MGDRRAPIDRNALRKQKFLAIITGMKSNGGKITVAHAANEMGYQSLKSFKYDVLPLILDDHPELECDGRTISIKQYGAVHE
ncbi:MAG TPA: hypothetical protein P5290_05840 [Candidatus Methanomethylicus sp.]|nr:hypothetical protein [Candidatus Methanomethylicus sp.]